MGRRRKDGGWVPNHPPSGDKQKMRTDGRSAEPEIHPTDCTACEGTGEMRKGTVELDRVDDQIFDGANTVPCNTCGGTGKEDA
jgi:DnaJ-class molecular chaperone